jgi:beta-glucosidase
LSYTRFAYAWKNIPFRRYADKNTIMFSVQVSNIWKLDGDEVVQAYIQYSLGGNLLLKELRQFQRINVGKEKSKIITFKTPVVQLQKWNINENRLKIYKGELHYLLAVILKIKDSFVVSILDFIPISV